VREKLANLIASIPASTENNIIFSFFCASKMATNKKSFMLLNFGKMMEFINLALLTQAYPIQDNMMGS
jgi:hypothetical protein